MNRRFVCTRSGFVRCNRVCVCVCVRSEHPGEAVVSGEEHAGSSTARPLHHGATRGILHGAVDRRIRLPEPGQVRSTRRIIMEELTSGC